jgi:large subunit ribosomal protein L25
MVTILKTTPREQLGSKAARALRAEKRIPCLIKMDPKADPLHLSVDEHDFFVARHEREHVYELDIEGSVEMALIHELQWDTFADRVQHIEFRRVFRGQKTKAEVELEFVGLPKGVLNHLLTHVTIEATPTDIPDNIEVNIDGLEAGVSITAGQLKLPEGVELLINPATVIAVVLVPRVEEAPKPEVPAEEAAAVPAAEPAGDKPQAGKPQAGKPQGSGGS